MLVLAKVLLCALRQREEDNAELKWKHLNIEDSCPLVQLELVTKSIMWPVCKSQDLRLNVKEIGLGKIGGFFCCLSNSGNPFCVCTHRCLRKNRQGWAPGFPLQEKGCRQFVCGGRFQSLWYLLHTVLESSTKPFGDFFSSWWCFLFHVFEALALFSCPSTLLYFWTSNTVPEDSLH